MKRLKTLSVFAIFVFSTFFSQAAFANTEAVNDNGQDLYMQERADVIADYLEEKINSDGVIGDDSSEFFAQHPEYIVKDFSNNQSVDVVETRTLHFDQASKLKRDLNTTSDAELIGVEVIFYSNGDYIISELKRKEISPDAQENVQSEIVPSEIVPKIRNYVLGQNTHHIYNTVGQYVGRTYVQATFWYDGTNVDYASSMGANTRCLLGNYSVSPSGSGYPAITHPPEYNNQICRASYTTFWYKMMPTYEQLALVDINRVSCNHQGKIFTTSPLTAG